MHIGGTFIDGVYTPPAYTTPPSYIAIPLNGDLLQPSAGRRRCDQTF